MRDMTEHGVVRSGPLAARKGDWMQTFTGRAFWPLDPRADEIAIEDIAHGLSMQCRYGGHCQRFYSVAEHSVLMARAAPAGLELTTLMHDASEAYLSDVIRPLKRHLANFKTIESELERVIAQRFDLPHPMPPEVKRLDERIIGDEKAQALAPAPPLHDSCQDHHAPPLGVTLQFWQPWQAKREFLMAFFRCGGIA
jgi:hypothetical protein